MAVSFFGQPGRRASLLAMVRPMPTETVTSTSATIPDARLTSHHPWSANTVLKSITLRPSLSGLWVGGGEI